MFIKNTRKERTQITKEQRKAAANQRSIERAEKTRRALLDCKIKKYGLSENSIVNEEITTNFVQYMTDDSQPILKDYCLKLVAGELKDKDTYFLPSDGKIYDLVKNFYDADIGTPMFEINTIDLTRWYNILRRQIARKPFDLSEKAIMGKVCQSYKTGDKLKGGIVRTVGKESHRNILKEVAWLVTHAYCTGLFATHKGIFAVLPKDNDQVITLWNGYIAAQTDIPESVRNMFTYSVDTGECEFLEKSKKKYSIFNEDGTVKPEDDPAFEENEFVDIKFVSLEENESIIEKNREMDDEYHDAMARDDKQAKIVSESVKNMAHDETSPMTDQEIAESKEKIKETDPKESESASIPGDDKIVNNIETNIVSGPDDIAECEKFHTVEDSGEEAKKEFTFGELRKISKEQHSSVNPINVVNTIINGEQQANPTTPTTGEEQAPAVVEETKEAENNVIALDAPSENTTNNNVEVIDDIYKLNNDNWHEKVYRLSHFTDIVHRKGYNVFYDIPSEYPGLIQVNIETKEGAIVNKIILDDCSIYGDTLRAITSYSKNHDIRKEIFVPISQDSDIYKMIDGKLTVSDRNRLTNKLPKCIVYCKGKYTFIDRVDMSGLHVGEIKGMDFETWKNLVTEIGKLVLEPDLTCIRWRIEYDKNNPNLLTMYSDNKVKYPFHSNIEGEPNNISAIRNRLCVEVDLNRHTDDGVAVYNIKQLATSEELSR